MKTTKSKNKKVKIAGDNFGQKAKHQRRSRGNHFTDSFGGVIYYKSNRNDRSKGKKKA